ncbi:RNA recognition motif domain-containing protein [Ditylenchus destructor]|nr:RNA recognition motif domain-containing protein [Ditylenchus destructor]
MSVLRKAFQRCVQIAPIPGVSSLRPLLCSNFNAICISMQAHTTCQAFKSKHDQDDQLYVNERIRRSTAAAKSEQTKQGKKKDFQRHRILVYGLSKRTTKRSVVEYFEKFGEIWDCHVKKQIATVEFQSPTQAFAAANNFNHFIDGQDVSVMAYSETDIRKRQIIVRGLSEETSPLSLRKFYSQFGEIALCRIAREEKNVSLGYAYIVFDSEEAVDLALNSLPHRIQDLEITEVEGTPVPPDLECTLEVRDLSLKTTNESLENFYSQFGELTRCEVKGEKSKANKGGQVVRYGIVEFVKKKSRSRAMSKRPHVIDGKEITDVIPLKNRPNKKKKAAPAATEEEKESDV